MLNHIFEMGSISESHIHLLPINQNINPCIVMNTISALFSKQANSTPKNIALVIDDQYLTYHELEIRSNQLAHYLIEKGVTTEDLIPICINRSFEMIIGILGILKAGGVYVPIDPLYPDERIKYIFNDTESTIALTDKQNFGKLQGLFPDINLIQINNIALDGENLNNNFPDTSLTPQNLAYIIYTSGSTGNPKGVMIEHHSVCNFILGQANLYNVSTGENILQLLNVCFDAAVEQIFLALLTGAKLTLIHDTDLKDNELLGEIICRNGITHLFSTPTLLENLSPETHSSLKTVVTVGDVCRQELVTKWASNVKFYNAYGPTETTVAATAYLCDLETVGNFTIIPIGKPLQHVKIYILDEHLNLVEDEDSGEIFIGGSRLARGYLNQPNLTAKAFIENPFVSGERIYKTGDIGKRTSSGEIVFLGRIDEQVKISG
ncbi:MAG: amino acid adenylation domain-containing protein, partial [Flavobacterium sp.]